MIDMNPNVGMSEYVAHIACATGTATTGSPVTSGWLDLRAYQARRFMVVAKCVGAAQNDGDIVITAEKASDNSGTGATTIRAETEAAHATENDNKAFEFDLGPHEFDRDLPFVRFKVSNGATGQTFILYVIATDLRYTPGADPVGEVKTIWRGGL